MAEVNCIVLNGAIGRNCGKSDQIKCRLPREDYYSYKGNNIHMTADIDVLKEGIEGLIRAGYYRSREALLEDAFRTMIEVKPSVKMEMAAELYKSEKVSLSRAAEIAGTSIEGFQVLFGIQRDKKISLCSL